MPDLIIKAVKVAVIVFWLAFVLSLVSVIPDPYGTAIIWLACAVLLLHLAEYVLVKFRVIELDSPEFSFVKTMLFGFTHWAPLMKGGRRRA